MADPGWYADPYDASQLRWWDGADWSDRTSPTTPPPPSSSSEWGTPRPAVRSPLPDDRPDPPERRVGLVVVAVLLVVVVLIAAASVVLLAARGEDGEDTATSTVEPSGAEGPDGSGGGGSGGGSGGGVNAGPDADLALIESCRVMRRTISTALVAWQASGGSSNPAEAHPESGYPMTLALLATSDAQMLQDPPNEADWAYDPAVGEASLQARPGGTYDSAVALVCNSG